jgi:hypothetical protein
MELLKTKMKSGGYWIPVIIEFNDDGRMYFAFKYDKGLIAEIKNLEGRKWHSYDKENPRSMWSCPVTERNIFTLNYLQGKNPYAPYEGQLLNVSPRRDLYKHQALLFRVGVTRKRCIFAAEPGTGKTLSSIELVEYLISNGSIKPADILYCGTISSLRSVELELEKWQALFVPRMYTYDRLRKADKDNEFSTYLPKLVIFDESSRLKNATAQRTQAAATLARLMREEYGDDCYQIEMTGSPSPKSPVDWHSQTEIVCPGFLVEPNSAALQRRLSLIEMTNGDAGLFPKMVTWLDDENKCSHKWKKNLGVDETGKDIVQEKVCGNFKGDPCHTVGEFALGEDSHIFQKSLNEVQILHKRLSGLVEVVLKKDCLDLPKRVEVEVKLPPSSSILRTAQMIVANSPRVITAMTLLRELSDGFQYEEKETGKKEVCPECKGTLQVKGLVERDGILSEIPEERPCDNCESGSVPLFQRSAIQCDTPKDQQLRDDLEDHEDYGRIIIAAAFQGSIDRVTKICLEEKWSVIQVDGRGWKVFTPEGPISMTPIEMLRAFQNKGKGKLAFVGHPASAGMGLTLTASPTIIWYSLPFSGEDFQQMCNRIDRPGSIGNNMRYYLHLPTDYLVLHNLRGKLGLQAITMGDRITADDIKKALNGL